ncbi:hypothetical protein GOP47_0024383 [Adiantum capillus-veneris]|uniref:Uncharacterized protein n=1 Tax=Adiantum capillus-veneris TaxID=13818 RepID=A0A9D4Z2Q8_ADICA|nr:hypothetical protein GOP47_0024383 [Adiantum capillus-veneris]
MEEVHMDEVVVTDLLCGYGEVDSCLSLVETDSDEARHNEYTCSYEEGESVGTMLQGNAIWNDFISSLSKDVAVG